MYQRVTATAVSLCVPYVNTFVYTYSQTCSHSHTDSHIKNRIYIILQGYFSLQINILANIAKKKNNAKTKLSIFLKVFFMLSFFFWLLMCFSIQIFSSFFSSRHFFRVFRVNKNEKKNFLVVNVLPNYKFKYNTAMVLK